MSCFYFLSVLKYQCYQPQLPHPDDPEWPEPDECECPDPEEGLSASDDLLEWTKSMPQIEHLPGWDSLNAGCIGQTHWSATAGAPPSGG